MEILWWQVLLLTLYAGYQIWDELHLYSSISQPVFAGLIAGLIMGDVTTGLVIGGSMQLMILGVGTFGGASRIDANSGTLLAVAFSVALGMEPTQAIATLAVPVASLMIQTDILARFTNTFFAHRIDTKIEEMNYKAIERYYVAGIIPWALSRMIPVFLALAFGGSVVKSVVHFLNTDLKWLGDGLTTAGAVLPAVGFAILLRYLPIKKHYMYFILGFVLTAIFASMFDGMTSLGTAVSGLDKKFDTEFNSLPMLAIALIGFAFAAMEYKRTSLAKPVKPGEMSETHSQNDDEGEIEDDEI
ncbi:PTS mannose/fructose/sorbose/N-acetylgalactosamine transporter subunit IIC [Mammaliicoccus stepanovicii]|uniref:PTS system, mannose/fructose/N -acetylgalactosamine-specific component IIC n=1 Tax=Mammaliicoccus stepanovicii TaxID=643214 RepID=A0A239YCW9_9STAP|nr:PTS sugar transporter subunit IIC [Mammaliicoccus stepanovicii]PNZ75527.1 PTS sugar transporter subunit IIC [Mammaliicoccus stepanovicii]GGI42597.1 PTS fructose transporter subunit IIC [Mammaliicoccus stepanovicii]SNV56550.1 PTS system, mannose/fructose/N -acetylgalactosamine-specific component IIC [Mammaliicoccus stepanovicii]